MLLFGYHGRRNIGDDAICITLIETLERTPSFEGVKLYVYTKEPYLQRNLTIAYSRVDFVSSVFGLLIAFLNSNAIIIDGGDILNDYGAFKSTIRVFAFFSTFAFITKMTHKKFIIINGGFQAKNRFNFALLGMTLRLADCISVRDKSSYKVASRFVSNKIKLGFDTAVLFDISGNINYSSIYFSKKTRDKKIIGISVTPVYSNYLSNKQGDISFADAIAKDINSLLHKIDNINVHFMAFNTDPVVGDLEIINKIREKLDMHFQDRVKTIIYTGMISKFLIEILEMDYVVCCKYHSILFSYLFEKPMLVIGYHPKNAEMIHEIGLPEDSLISLDGVLNGEFGLKLMLLLENPERFSATLPLHTAKQRSRSSIQDCSEQILL